MDLAPRVKLICGLYLSLSIISTVLACALWNFPNHSPTQNTFFFSGLMVAFMINSGIAYCLLVGTIQNNSKLFFPYIVCASIHTAISGSAIAYFLLSSIFALTGRKPTYNLYAFAVFVLLFGFWYWSLITVRQYRDHVREISGEHVKLSNEELL